MNFSEAIKSVFRNYANFSGRARRSEYWFFTLFCMIVNSCIQMIALFAPETVAIFISLAYGLGFMLPSISVSVRRLHDVGKSGWYYFAPLFTIPIFIVLAIIAAFQAKASGDVPVGMISIIIIMFLLFIAYGIYMLVLYCKDSEFGANEYGENPKGINGDSSQF